ncbi:MAG: DUF4124 domain-containing protein [Gammaproteobacteria bacterium]|nr:DUF4124 domain-containing protein [Gammaproteobacteria bacterium]
MSKRLSLSLLLSIAVIPLCAMGDQVYRMVDDRGQVIFTDSPPKGARQLEKIELPPGPSAESVRSTESRNRAIRKRLDEVQNARSQENQQQNRRIRQAEKALAEAEERLTFAKQLRDEDRQSLAAGVRRIRPAYFERVKKAEAEVEAARNKLEEARKAR